MNFIFNQGPSLNSRCKSTHHVHDLCLHQDKRRSFTRRRVSEIYLTLNVFVVLKYYTHKCQFASILDLWPLGGQEIDLWYIVKRHIIACEPSIQKCNVKLKHYWPTLWKWKVQKWSRCYNEHMCWTNKGLQNESNWIFIY